MHQILNPVSLNEPKLTGGRRPPCRPWPGARGRRLGQRLKVRWHTTPGPAAHFKKQHKNPCIISTRTRSAWPKNRLGSQPRNPKKCHQDQAGQNTSRGLTTQIFTYRHRLCVGVAHKWISDGLPKSRVKDCIRRWRYSVSNAIG